MGPLPALLVSFLQQAVASTGACVGPLSAYSPEDLVGNSKFVTGLPVSFYNNAVVQEIQRTELGRGQKTFLNPSSSFLVIVSCGKRMEESEFRRMFEQRFSIPNCAL